MLSISVAHLVLYVYIYRHFHTCIHTCSHSEPRSGLSRPLDLSILGYDGLLSGPGRLGSRCI